MRRSRTAMIIAAVVLAGAGLGTWAVVRGRGAQTLEEQAAAVRQAEFRREYAALPVEPLRPALKVVPSLVAEAAERSDLLAPAQRAALGRAVGEVLEARFDATPEAWIMLRERDGYVPRSLDDPETREHVEWTLRVVGAAPPASGEELEQIWTRLAVASDAKPSNRLVGVASEPGGWSVATTTATRATLAWPYHPDAPGTPGGTLSIAEGHGSVPGFWQHPRGHLKQLESGTPVLLAAVLFKAAFADGVDRPVNLVFVWDGLTGRWLLEYVSAGIVGGVGSALRF